MPKFKVSKANVLMFTLFLPLSLPKVFTPETQESFLMSIFYRFFYRFYIFVSPTPALSFSLLSQFLFQLRYIQLVQNVALISAEQQAASVTHTHILFLYCFPLWSIAGQWMQLSVLYSRTLLFIHSMYKSSLTNYGNFPAPQIPNSLLVAE